jgi:hypothetical protein
MVPCRSRQSRQRRGKSVFGRRQITRHADRKPSRTAELALVDGVRCCGTPINERSTWHSSNTRVGYSCAKASGTSTRVKRHLLSGTPLIHCAAHSCFAQARGGHSWQPVRRMRLTPGVSGRNFPRFRYPAFCGKPVIFNPLKIPLIA